MLVAIIMLYHMGGKTFDILELTRINYSEEIQIWLFLAFFAAFAVKMPMFPVHTWLPDAHTEAPTAGSVILAGILLKMGAYGFLRFSLPMFPNAVQILFIPLLILSVTAIIYGAYVTLMQNDMKRLVAYSSVSHMGFVLLGLASAKGAAATLGMTGAALQMFTHGTITALLFLTVGYIYEKAHTRHIPDLGGLAGRMPFLATSLLIAGLASLGLPGTSGFVAEVTIFLGSFPAWQIFTIIATVGVVLTAAYILWMIQRTIFGPRPEHHNNLLDASLPEMVPVAILVVAIISVGIYPSVISEMFSTGLEPIVTSMKALN